jgi:hypothetical protein
VVVEVQRQLLAVETAVLVVVVMVLNLVALPVLVPLGRALLVELVVVG